MPNNWKKYKLSDVSKLITKGTTPSTYGYKFIDEGVNYIKSDSTSYDGSLNPSVFVSISKEAHEKLKRSQLQENDILFSIAGAYLGKSGMVKLSHLPANTNQANAIIRVDKSKVLPKFINLLLRDPKLVHYVNASSGQSAQPNLNLTDLGNLEFNIPDLKEQTQIANILSAIDNKIENNLAINKTLEEMAMALYKHWFVDFGPFKNGEFIDSELGKIPEGWVVKKLGDLIEVVNGFAFKSKWFEEKGEKVLKIKNISNNVVNIENCSFISSVNSKTINQKFKVSKGDFLIAMTGAEVGKTGVVPDYKQTLWLNQRVGKLKDKAFKNSSILVGKILQSKEYYEIIQGLAYGSAQPNISAKGIENIEICLPKNLSVLENLIGSFVNSHNQIVYGLTENQSLTKLRDTLLPKLISGEIRLNEFQEKVETILQ